MSDLINALATEAAAAFPGGAAYTYAAQDCPDRPDPHC